MNRVERPKSMLMSDWEKYCETLEYNIDLGYRREQALYDKIDELNKLLYCACRQLAKYDNIIYQYDEPTTADDWFTYFTEDFDGKEN